MIFKLDYKNVRSGSDPDRIKKLCIKEMIAVMRARMKAEDDYKRRRKNN